MTDIDRINGEQFKAVSLREAGKTIPEISEIMKISTSAVRRRINGFKKKEKLDPELAKRLNKAGITDFAGLHSGWLLEKDQSGSGHSLYFYLGPDEEKIDFLDLLKDSLSTLEPLPPIQAPKFYEKDLCNFFALADLHLGSQYGDGGYVETINTKIDDLMARIPAAEKAVIIELGDLLDANDHKGVTPGSGNNCDVIREDTLKNTRTGIEVLDRMIRRALEKHQTVEVHLMRGNHDETAYIGVLVGLAERYRDNPRVTVVEPSNEWEDDFRVIQWGMCAVFPNHGDKAKWPELKDVWTEIYPDEWAKAKVEREIWTAHFHHDKVKDMVGVKGRHFRTLMAPNKWARQLGLISRGSLVCSTKHKYLGTLDETQSNVLPKYVIEQIRKAAA